MNNHHPLCAPRVAFFRFAFTKHWLLAPTWLAFAQLATAQTTWTGATNSHWSLASNWTNGVPDINDNVTIPDVGFDPVILNGVSALAKSVAMTDVNIQLTVNTGGSLLISGSSSGGLSVFDFNDLVIQTGAVLIINGTGTIGLWNRGTVTNGGILSIDGTGNHGIMNIGDITNTGTINIGATTGVGGDGIRNTQTGNISNAAIITIGQGAAIGSIGIYNMDATFTNAASGQISIHSTASDGIQNNSAGTSFVNYGEITMENAGAASIRVQPNSIFNNASCNATIYIDGIIQNNGTSDNAGSSIETATDNSNISSNTGIVQNLNGGTFTIGSGNAAITTAGIIWIGCTSTNWNVATNWHTGTVPTATDDVIIPNTSNDPVILSGAAAVAMSVQLLTGAVLTLHSGGSLAINGSSGTGLANEGTVNNAGTINLGLHNKGTFTNETGGYISVDQTGYDGIYSSFTFINGKNLGSLKNDRFSIKNVDQILEYVH